MDIPVPILYKGFSINYLTYSLPKMRNILYFKELYLELEFFFIEYKINAFLQ